MFYILITKIQLITKTFITYICLFLEQHINYLADKIFTSQAYNTYRWVFHERRK